MTAMSTRVLADEPPATQPSPGAASPTGTITAPSASRSDVARAGRPDTVDDGSGVVPDAEPPQFDPGYPLRLMKPDAPTPEEGGRLRAYVEVQADGAALALLFAPAPGSPALDASFEVLSRQALEEARFQRDPSAGPTAYCLEFLFRPHAPAPRLIWLAGAAGSAARCLTGSAVTSREVDLATPP